ncbi:MAG: hypothetical protein II537_05965 [Bacteroidales bacterium]|nr:hypothetical protein [Bacteroidales bacterium]
MVYILIFRNHPAKKIFTPLSGIHPMNPARLIICNALTDFSIQLELIHERILVLYRHNAVTPARPGGYHNIIHAGQI